MNYFKPKNELKTKINFLVKVHKIEIYSIFLGLSYIQYCKDITHVNLHNYTLCAIILANKYLNDYNYNIFDIINSVDINIQDYLNMELKILHDLDWNLSTINEDVMIKYKHLIKCW